MKSSPINPLLRYKILYFNDQNNFKKRVNLLDFSHHGSLYFEILETNLKIPIKKEKKL